MTPGRVAASSFIIILTLAASFITVTTLIPMTSKAVTLYVGGAGPGNYTTIQAAVDAANPGDVILVYNGTYVENVIIDKTLSLIGQTRNATVIDGGFTDAVRVVADWVNVSGFTLTSNGGGLADASLRLDQVIYCRITYNDFVNTRASGVLLDLSYMNTVSYNNFSATSQSGVTLFGSKENTISGNNISKAYNGVALWDADANIVTGNLISEAVGIPHEEFRAAGIYLYHSNGTYVARNRITNGYDGIHLWSSSRGTISENNISENLAGIYLGFHWDFPFASSGNAIERNNISGNSLGIGIGAAGRNVMSRNVISMNSMAGFYDLGGIANVLDNNTIANNDIGVWLADTMWDTVSRNTVAGNNKGIIYSFSNGVDQNAFYHNRIINNTNQSYDVGVDTWDDGYPSGGNYWSDYGGTDNYGGPNQNIPGGDGRGDTPYNISGGSNKDRYPLVGPYVGPPPPDLVISPADVTFYPDSPFKVRDSVSVNATVRNLGWLPSGSTSVRFYDGVPPSAKIGADQALGPLARGGSATVFVVWTPSVGGNHDICIAVDPDNVVKESNETNNMICVRIAVNFAVWLKPGLRFMSFPSVVVNDSIESVLSELKWRYNYVRWYDSLDTMSPWKSYVPGRGPNSLSRLDNTMGFWINIVEAWTFVVVGSMPSSTTITLRQGWNMVGFPSFNTSYTVADLKASISSTEVIVETFDSSAGPYYLQRVDDRYLMKAGEGYWICVNSDTTWIVNG